MGGRRKSADVDAQLQEMLAQGKTTRQVVEAIIAGPCKGDAAMMRVLLDRSDGPIQQLIAANLSGSVVGLRQAPRKPSLCCGATAESLILLPPSH